MDTVTTFSIAGTAKAKSPPDVIVFQEVVAHTYKAHLSQHLRAGGYTVLPATVPDRQNFEVIAFREPYFLGRHVEEPLVDSQFGRVLHIVDLLDATGNTVRVLTGHFDSGKDSGKIRSAQLAQTAGHLTTGTPGVFGGDANLRKAFADKLDEAEIMATIMITVAKTLAKRP